MATYTLSDMAARLLPTGLDETALFLGMQRFTGESLSEFRRRLLLEVRDPAGPQQNQFIRSLGRQVGEFDIPMLVIGLKNSPADPFLEVTSTYIRGYSDYENGTLDFEANIADRDGSYFMVDVETAIGASGFFTTTALDSSYDYYRADHLRFGNTERMVTGHRLRSSYTNSLDKTYIRTLYPPVDGTFGTDVGSVVAIAASGDYHLDNDNGVLFSYDLQAGSCSFTYRDFPHTLWWQPVRAFPVNCEDMKYITMDPLLDNDTGTEDNVMLNEYGAELYNTILAVCPLGWGE